MKIKRVLLQSKTLFLGIDPHVRAWALPQGDMLIIMAYYLTRFIANIFFKMIYHICHSEECLKHDVRIFCLFFGSTTENTLHTLVAFALRLGFERTRATFITRISYTFSMQFASRVLQKKTRNTRLRVIFW